MSRQLLRLQPRTHVYASFVRAVPPLRTLRHQPGRHALSQARLFVPSGFLMIFPIVGRWRRFLGFLFLKFACRSQRFLGVLMFLRPRSPRAVRPLSPRAGLLFAVRKSARRCPGEAATGSGAIPPPREAAQHSPRHPLPLE